MTIETEPKSKKFFPEHAEPPSAPSGAIVPKVAAKRTPWMKKPIVNPHATPASPCISLRDKFDNYVINNYKHIKADERATIWQTVACQIVETPKRDLIELINNHFSK